MKNLHKLVGIVIKVYKIQFKLYEKINLKYW